MSNPKFQTFEDVTLLIREDHDTIRQFLPALKKPSASFRLAEVNIIQLSLVFKIFGLAKAASFYAAMKNDSCFAATAEQADYYFRRVTAIILELRARSPKSDWKRNARDLANLVEENMEVEKRTLILLHDALAPTAKRNLALEYIEAKFAVIDEMIPNGGRCPDLAA